MQPRKIVEKPAEHGPDGHAPPTRMRHAVPVAEISVSMSLYKLRHDGHRARFLRPRRWDKAVREASKSHTPNNFRVLDGWSPRLGSWSFSAAGSWTVHRNGYEDGKMSQAHPGASPS
jgi:hypothetical protein